MVPHPRDDLSAWLQSCQQVAVLYGISETHVRLMALSRGFGRVTDTGELMFTAAEVEALRPRGRERPWAERDIPWIELA